MRLFLQATYICLFVWNFATKTCAIMANSATKCLPTSRTRRRLDISAKPWNATYLNDKVVLFLTIFYIYFAVTVSRVHNEFIWKVDKNLFSVVDFSIETCVWMRIMFFHLFLYKYWWILLFSSEWNKLKDLNKKSLKFFIDLVISILGPLFLKVIKR